MRSPPLVLVFLLGAVAGALFTPYRWRNSSLFQSALNALPGSLSKCADIYKGYPLSPIYSVSEMPPAAGTPAGLQHITLHGKHQHGLRGLELWMETFAPGAATPIHRHECEEIWLVLRGTGVVSLQDKDGRVIEAPIGPNSTFTVLPNARHAVRAEGPDDLHAVVAIDHPPFRAVIFKSWEDREDAGHEVFPIFWDQACPKAVPASLAHLVVHGGGGGGGTAEL